MPTDRPTHRLVVTIGPFHIVNALLQRPQLPETTVPVTVSSISELENMVTITGAPVGQLLLERAAGPQRSTCARCEALPGHTHHRNTVLDAGGDNYPWRHATAEQAPSEPTAPAL